MIDEATIEALAKFLEYMAEPQNALGLWIAASGLIWGAHLLSPMLLT